MELALPSVLARLPRAQIVHLATHGLLDDVQESRPKMPFARHAAISGLLKPGTTQFRAPGSLALAPDAQGVGLLTADEIAQSGCAVRVPQKLAEADEITASRATS